MFTVCYPGISLRRLGRILFKVSCVVSVKNSGCKIPPDVLPEGFIPDTIIFLGSFTKVLSRNESIGLSQSPPKRLKDPVRNGRRGVSNFKTKLFQKLIQKLIVMKMTKNAINL